MRSREGLLRYCSNNLNQYAKRANETGSVYTEDIKDLQNRQNEIREITKEILSAMVVGLLYLVLVVCIVMLLFQHVWIYAIPLFWISFCICFIVLVNFTAFAMVING
nr:plasmid mobilization relaxosome protein MobC [uncultured Enterocloster sp.]